MSFFWGGLNPLNIKVDLSANVTVSAPPPAPPPLPKTWMLKLGKTVITYQGFLHMAITLPDTMTQPFVGPKAGVDIKGNPTVLTGSVLVTVSDPAILALVQPDPATPNDPFSGVVSAVGPVGTAQLKFEDDTDGSQPLIALIDFTVVASATVALAAPTFGPQVPAAAPPAPAKGTP